MKSNPNPTDTELAEKLLSACLNGRTEEVQELVKNPRIDVTYKENQPIAKAASYGHNEIIKILLNKGATFQDPTGDVLHLAIQNGNEETIQILIKEGAEPNPKIHKPAETAAIVGRTEILKILQQNGADIHANEDACLLSAASLGHVETTQYLLDQGADPRTDDDRIIRLSCSNNQIEVVKLLLKVVNYEKENPSLAFACLCGIGETQRALKLLEENPSIDIGINNNLALHWACTNEQTEAIEALFHLKDYSKEEKSRVIGTTTRRGRINAVKLLIKKGADVTTNENGLLHIAHKHKHKEVGEQLLRAHSTQELKTLLQSREYNASGYWASESQELLFPKHLIELEYQRRISKMVKLKKDKEPTMEL